MSSFAEKQLLKYGWQKGQGLGKLEAGIAKPIAPFYQKDTSGLGSSDGLFHPWWEDVYSKALSGINVQQKSAADDNMAPAQVEEETKKKKSREKSTDVKMKKEKALKKKERKKSTAKSDRKDRTEKRKKASS